MFISNEVYDDGEDDVQDDGEDDVQVHDNSDDVLDVQSLDEEGEGLHNNRCEQQESLLRDKRSIDNTLSSPFLKVLYS